MGSLLGPYRYSSGEFLPTSIATCSLWLDASDAASITETAGAVSQWSDKSGNARHFTQATGANQPITGTRTINSLNALDFDGTNDLLKIASNANLQDGTTGAWTWFVVAAADATTGIKHLVDADEASNRVVQVLRLNGTALETIGFTTAGSAVSDAAGVTVNTSQRVFQTRHTGTSLEAFVDGVGNGATAAASQRNAAAPYVIGAGWAGNTEEFPSGWFNGLIAEVICYASALSSEDQTTVLDALQTKWDTP